MAWNGGSVKNFITSFALVSVLVLISIASAGTIQLPETGQSSCYNASGTAISCTGTGQDGALRMGVAWPSPRFSDINGDQTLRDNLTGLVWSKDANSAAATKNWQEALDYVRALNNTNYLGYNDWRLPNRKELMSLINLGQADIASWLIIQGFGNVQSSYYWSSSSYADSTNAAWTLHMYDSSVSGSNKANNYYVWPVRAGQPGIFGPFYSSITTGMYFTVALGNNARATYSITNRSATFHPLTKATITGANATDFTITNDTCSNQTISAGNACTMDVIFTPSASGSRTATLNLASGTDTASIPLSGTGSSDIRGTVTDLSTGLPLSGVTVALSGGGSVTTASDGTFSFAPAYSTFNNVTLSKTGYSSYSVNNITTSTNQGAQLKLGMAPTGLLNITTPSPLVPTSTFTDTIKVTGGAGPYTFSLAYGNLPAGLTLDISLGTITGIPATSGSHVFAIGVTDSLGTYAEREYTVNFPVISTVSYLQRATQNVAYSVAILVPGGIAPIRFSSTWLPNGLILDSTTGVLSGTPTTVGSFKFDITATDSTGRSYMKTFRMYVENPLSFSTASLANGQVGVAYNQSVIGTGGMPPYSWSLSSGSLPTGLTLNTSTGSISGIPTRIERPQFTIKLTDANNKITSRSYTVDIANPFFITSTNLSRGMLGVAYSTLLSNSGGSGPYSFLITSGTLPSGLYISSSSGVISGTPSTSGSWQFTAQVADSFGRTDSKTFTINVDPVFSITTSKLANVVVGNAYNQVIYASGGLPTYTWGISSGVLPSGLSLNPSNGVISGTPTSIGTQQIVITAQDSAGRSTSRQYTIAVTGPLTLLTTTMPNGAINEPYSEYMRASGGVPPYTFTLAATSQLPAGLSLNSSTGLIYGTPTVAGLTNAAINVTDSSYPTPQALTSSPFSIRIWSLSTITTSAALPGIRTGQAMTPVTLVAKAGTAPYRWSLLSGSMPSGVTLSSGGVISGTPTTPGSYTFTIRATDSALTPVNADKLFYLTVSDPIQISTQSISFGSVGVPFSHTLYAANGVAPYTWNISSGALPPGLSFNPSSGVISGTPTTIGNSSVTFGVTDNDSPAQTTSKQLVVYIDPLTITTLTLPNGNQEVAYNANITTLGGVAPVAWSITSGALPQGITIDSVSGVISGTAPYCGSFPVAIQAVDSATPVTTAGSGYTLNIACAPGYSVTGSISINNGDANTISSAVNLTIAVANNVLARQMRFSTDNATWSNWETYATGKNYNLAAGFGTKYVYVQIKDAADKVATFVDSIYVRTFYPLTLAFAGTGGGSVNGGMSCVKGGSCPPQSFEESTQVTLTPSADSNSTFTSWSAACVVSGINCVVTMNSAKTATATFTEADKVRIGAVPYKTLTTAFANAAAGLIQARSIEFAETFSVALPTAFKGGWNNTFGSNIGTFTTLNGTLTIGAGSLTVEGLSIR